jgi:DNA-directed RNA polymerase specialized sigma24 family protein
MPVRVPSGISKRPSFSPPCRWRSSATSPPHQREILVAVTLNDVPIDVLADRLDSSRGALYKTIHDARHALRAALADRGLSLSEYLEASGTA